MKNEIKKLIKTILITALSSTVFGLITYFSLIADGKIDYIDLIIVYLNSMIGILLPVLLFPKIVLK